MSRSLAKETILLTNICGVLSGQEPGSRGGGGLRDGDEGHVEAEFRGRGGEE